MGNLLSIHTVIYLKSKPGDESSSPLNILTEILDKYGGMSYNGYPIYIKEGGNNKNRFYKISYGEKAEPRELIKFANSHPELISKLFARTYYESGEFDYFLSTPFDSSEYEIIRKPCRYGFDEITFKLTKGEEINYQDLKSDSIGGRVLINGELNSISDLIEQEDNDILSKPLENYRSVHSYSTNNFKTQNSELLSEILAKSQEVKFLYKGNTIHHKIRTEEFSIQNPKLSSDPRMIINFKNAKKWNEGYFDFYSCGWVNCINDEYLNYLKKIENKTDT
jgi:hypothetical protein